MAKKSDIVFVREKDAPLLAPPLLESGALGWFRQNILSTMNDFSSVGGAVRSLIMAAATLFIFYYSVNILWALIDFTLIEAVWSNPQGLKRELCTTALAGGVQHDGWHGACWPLIFAKIKFLTYGAYPFEELWRVNLAGVILIAGLVALMFERMPYRIPIGLFMLVIYPFLAFALLYGLGDWAGLPFVYTYDWGGILVTLVVALTGIVVSLPLGIALALGRQSKMPVIRGFCTIFIEFWRGIPLITVLFMASVALPLFLPKGVNIDNLLRALIGVTLFASAYMAEVIRGGLQAIDKGQYEAGTALGLNYWKNMRLIILPQALKHVIPGIVNTFIGLFKDTTLVAIIGLFDLLGAAQAAVNDASWSTPVQAITLYVYVALFYFICCFIMSRYSMRLERKLAKTND